MKILLGAFAVTALLPCPCMAERDPYPCRPGSSGEGSFILNMEDGAALHEFLRHVVFVSVEHGTEQFVYEYGEYSFKSVRELKKAVQGRHISHILGTSKMIYFYRDSVREALSGIASSRTLLIHPTSALLPFLSMKEWIWLKGCRLSWDSIREESGTPDLLKESEWIRRARAEAGDSGIR